MGIHNFDLIIQKKQPNCRILSETKASSHQPTVGPKIIDIKKTAVLQSNSAVTAIITMAFFTCPEKYNQ